MPKIKPSPASLVERLDAAAGRHPQAQRRKMFGCPTLFVNGNYATGLFEESWVVRLDEAGMAEVLALPGAGRFSPMAGRAMKGWATLPADVVADEAALDGWIERSMAYAASLPPKA